MSEAVPAYSAIRRAGDLVFVSGQLGIDGGGPQDVAAETRRALGRATALLSEQGGGRDDIVKCTVFLADMSDWAEMNAVFAAYFTEPYPARSAIGSELALGARVEIEAIAYIPEARLPRDP